MSDENEVTEGGPEDDKSQVEPAADEANDEPADETGPENSGDALLGEGAGDEEPEAEPDAAEEGLEVPEPDEPPAVSDHDAALKNYKICAGENAAAKQARKYPSADEGE